VAEILKYSAPERFFPYQAEAANLKSAPIVPGGIYGTVYLTREQFRQIVDGGTLSPQSHSQAGAFPQRRVGNWWKFGARKPARLFFLVFRDLRDTLISHYFSAKHSHIVMNEFFARYREELNSMDMESGLLSMISNPQPGPALHFALSAQIQLSWLGQPGVLCLRYEDILGNEYTFFEKLIEYCQIPMSRERLHDIVRHNIFEVATGRARGQEDIHAHLRKGIAGDWRNYFTGRVTEEFKRRYGDVLIRTGYEANLDW